MAVNLKIVFDPEKDELLKELRGLGFEDILAAISEGGLLSEIAHPKKDKYPNQKLWVVYHKRYVYIVPFVYDKTKNTVYLKTIYPSRKYTKLYKGKAKHENK